MIDVGCQRTDTGWRCDVRVVDEQSASEHTVTIAPADLERLDPSASDPTDLVRRSFEFLLEREAKESILRSFDLPMIERYFPEYERMIRPPV
jgi:hypothetical protein